MSDDQVTISLNGKEITARKGQLVIDAADEHGVYIPRFCYHPRMQPVGMCRMCIVDIDTGRGPALQPSCMIPVAEGMKVDADSPGVVKAQDGVLEFLLINHPLDCPVCDKGGECPLQDQAYAYGPGESRFVEEKRHFEKPIPISKLVLLDRERCILCDRCTRFAKDVAGDPLIHFIDRGNETQVNTFPDHPFASYFSGNTVQICPVGALTGQPYRFRARPWDLEKVESTCTVCSFGCRIVIEASRNRVLRYQGVDIDPVNWSWLCDKGRFSFEAINHEDRLGQPLVRAGDELVGASWSDAITLATEALRKAISSTGAPALGVIGGARLTNEAAYAWAKFAKGVLGTDNIDCQLGDGLPADVVLGLPRATIDEVCDPAGTTVLLSADVREELPVLYLRLRDAVVHRGMRLVEINPVESGVTHLAAQSVRYAPGDVTSAMREVITNLPDGPVRCVIGRPSLAESAESVVAAAALLLEARPDATFLPALRRANVFGAIDMGLAPGVLPGRVSLDEARSWFAGAWDTVPVEHGLDTTGILTAAAEGRIETLVLLGADPIADFPDRDLATRALAGARTVIAVECFLNESSAQADVVLPVGGYAETGGTTTNIEGRVSRLHRKVTPPGTARDYWVVATDLAYRLGADLGLDSLEAIWAEVERLAPAHAGVTRELLDSPSGRDGVVVPLDRSAISEWGTPVSIEGGRIPTGPTDPTTPGPGGLDAEDAAADKGEATIAGADAEGAPTAEAEQAASAESAARVSDAVADEPEDADDARSPGRPALLRFNAPPAGSMPPPPDSYSLRLVATRKLYDKGTWVAHTPWLADLAAGGTYRANPYDLDRIGAGAGSRVKVSSARGSATVEIQPDPTVPRGIVVVPVNQDGAVWNELIDATAPVTEIRMESV